MYITRIFFPNEKAVQFSVEDEIHACSAALLGLMAEHLEIDVKVANDTFALWLVSPLLEIQLKPYHIPYEAYEKWTFFLNKFTMAGEYEILFDEPLLVIRRNFNLTIECERLFVEEYDVLTEVLYLDAKDQYMSGRYLVEIELAIELAALQLAIDFEPFEDKNKAIDLIQDNLGLLVPQQHLTTIRAFRLFGLSIMECKSGLESALITEYQNASDRFINNNERRKMFLTILQKTSFYGATFFTGTKNQKSGFLSNFFRRSYSSNVIIGINHKYITVVNPTRHELIVSQLITNCTWTRSSDLKNGDEIPLLILQYPDDCAHKKNKETANTVSVKFKKKTFKKNNNQNNEIIEKEEQKYVAIINKQIFSKQAVIMEELLNSLNNKQKIRF